MNNFDFGRALENGAARIAERKRHEDAVRAAHFAGFCAGAGEAGANAEAGDENWLSVEPEYWASYLAAQEERT